MKLWKPWQSGVVLVSHDEHLIEIACQEVWLYQTVHRLEGVEIVITSLHVGRTLLQCIAAHMNINCCYESA